MKRTFAILLSLTLIISCFWLTGAAAQAQDLEDQHRSAATLKALGLLSGYTAGDDSYLTASVTRAEFVKMAVKLFNAPTGSSTVQRFLDVPADHEYAAEINEAVERGLVVGNGDSYFYPDSVITGPQAVKIALELIGYGTYAAVNGGYPTGYYVAANYAGVRVNGVDNSELTRGQGIRLLFDAVTAKQLVQTSFGENPEFQARKDVTFLSENHKIYKITGLVTSTYLTSFYGRGTVANGQAEITASEGIYILEAGKLDVDAALGCNVTAYYKDNVSESTLDLLYLEPSAKNTITTVKDSNIVSFTDNAYTYYTDAQSGRTEKAKLSDSAAILYNGAALSDSGGITPDIYTPSVGFVTLIDYDSDGYVDVLKISSYVNFVVGGLDKDKYIVYDKYDSNKSIILDEDSPDQTVLF